MGVRSASLGCRYSYSYAGNALHAGYLSKIRPPNITMPLPTGFSGSSHGQREVIRLYTDLLEMRNGDMRRDHDLSVSGRIKGVRRLFSLGIQV